MILIDKKNPSKVIESKIMIEGYTDIFPVYIWQNEQSGLLDPVWNEKENVWVEGATPEEIAAYHRQKEYESDLEFARQKKADGRQFYEEIDARQVGMMRGKTPDEIDDLDVEYKRKILPYIEVVNGGQWWTAKRLMNNTTMPKIDIVKDLFIEVRQRIRDYVTNNYPTNGTNN